MFRYSDLVYLTNQRGGNDKMILFALGAALAVLGNSHAGAQSIRWSPRYSAQTPTSNISSWPSLRLVPGVFSDTTIARLGSSSVGSGTDSVARKGPDTTEVTHWHRVAVGAAIGATVGAIAGAIIGHQANTKCTGGYCDGTVADAVKFGLLGVLVGGIAGDAWPAGGRESQKTSRDRQRALRITLGFVLR